MRHGTHPPPIVTTWLCTGGSRLATPRGPARVEALAPGDTLLGQDGTPLPIRWIGRLHLPAAALADHPELWPVHAPQGTLLPAQPLALEGFPPVAARWLVDGHALTRPRPQQPLDIYTLDLDGTAPPAGTPCLEEGAPEPPRPNDATLHALRQALAGPHAPTGPLAGRLDEVTRTTVSGWVALKDGTGPLAVELVLNGVPHPPVPADTHRPDLEAAGIGDGHRGFRFVLEPPLDPRRRHLVRVRRALDGADLPGSPALLDAAVSLGAVLEGMDDSDALREAARALAARIEA